MSHQNRREFLGRTLAAAGLGAGFAIGGTKSSGRVIGANDTVRVGVAGLNGRGQAHVGAFAAMKGVEIAYLIDPDARTFGPRLEQIKNKGKGKGQAEPKLVADVRRALDDPSLDALSIATPNHWHALMTVWGVQAGKDVYVEKPCSHNVREGRVAVEAARKHNRIVQHGTQSRSSAEWAHLAALVKKGHYGKLLVSRALCYKPRNSIGVKPNGNPPKGLDYNLWVGPALETAYNGNFVPYNWHWFWEFGNGDIGNQGVHQMDIARWLIPGATLPKSAVSVGGRFGYEDQGETANTQVALLDFGDTQLVFEVRGLKTEPFEGQKVGNIAEFEGGHVTTTKNGLRFFPKGDKSSRGEPLPDRPDDDSASRPEGGHFDNFIAAVRSRKVSDLNADILDGHYSSALCHLANLSYRLGEVVPFSGSDAKPFGGCAEGNETFERMRHHLADDNALKLEGLDYRLGRKLEVNAKTETFVNDPEADKLLTRAYRAPFVLPEPSA